MANRNDIPPEDFRPDPPLTEDEAEKLIEDGERLSERAFARFQREGHTKDLKTIFREELTKRALERGEPDFSPEEQERCEALLRAVDLRCGGKTQQQEADRVHPLADRARQLMLEVHAGVRENDWLADDVPSEHPLLQLLTDTSNIAVKLAGALNGPLWPPIIEYCATTLVPLKRARESVDDALISVADGLDQNLAREDWLTEVKLELEAIGAECDVLIAGLRARLKPYTPSSNSA